MAKNKLSVPKIALIIGVVIVVFTVMLGSSGNVGKFNRPLPWWWGYGAEKTLAIPFAVDAWEYSGWGDCKSQTGGQAWADAYCRCKGYCEATSCYHASHNNRWIAKLDTKTCSWSKGTSTGPGIGFDTIKCRLSQTGIFGNTYCP